MNIIVQHSESETKIIITFSAANLNGHLVYGKDGCTLDTDCGHHWHVAALTHYWFLTFFFFRRPLMVFINREARNDERDLVSFGK